MIHGPAASHTVPNKLINIYRWERVDLIQTGKRKLFYHKASLLTSGFTVEVDGNKTGELCGWKIYYIDTLVATGSTGGVAKSKQAACEWFEHITDWTLALITQSNFGRYS